MLIGAGTLAHGHSWLGWSILADTLLDPTHHTPCFSPLQGSFLTPGPNPIIFVLRAGNFPKRIGAVFLKRDGMVGRTISHYQVVEKIGEGGMGVVYKAKDTRLNRHVALKFLREEAFGSDNQRARFVREAQTAAALDHPNICTVYEIDETDDQIFISMAYQEGVNLDRVIESGSLDLEQAIDIAIRVAQGLEAAHRVGIYHCDVKSSNIMLNGINQVQIMDFGLAKLAEEIDVAKTPTILGTMAYMSPEQARGDAVDHRTDIWSLGVCLYEMLAGRLPFTGDYADAVFYTIVNEEPIPISDLRPGIPPRLERVVEKTLAKSVDDRFRSTGALVEELREIKRELGGAQTSETYANQPSIAVLPFTDMSPERDQEFFCDGIAEEIINALTKIDDLRVVARTSAFAFKARRQDIRDIGRSLNVTTVLEGSVRKSGQMLRITAQLIDVFDGFHLWSERFDRQMEDVFAIQDEIAQAIVAMLRVKLAGGPTMELVHRYTENLDAYTLYLKGRYYWNKRSEEGLKKGLDCFEQAIGEDSNYALAYAGLADSFNLLGFYGILPPREAFPKAQAAAQKALEMDATIAEAETSLAFSCMFYDWDWARAERAFKHAIELNPNYPTALHWYAEYLVLMGRGDETVAQSRKALESDPLSLIINTLLGWAPHYERKYDEAVEQYHRTLEMDPNFVPAHFFLGLTYVQKSMFEEAIAEFQQATSLFGESTLFVVVQGYAYAASGHRKEAQMVLDEMERVSEGTYIQPYYTAAVHHALGNSDQTFSWLDRACEERDTWVAFLKVDPIWDGLRTDKRFISLLRRVKLAS
jgi:serine/threonine-protein kinase